VQTHPKRDSFELTILFPFFGLLSQGGVVGLCTKMNKKSVQILVQTGFEKTLVQHTPHRVTFPGCVRVFDGDNGDWVA